MTIDSAVAGLAFGTGVAIVDWLWGNCDWGRNDIDIDVNRYNNTTSTPPGQESEYASQACQAG